MADPNWRATLRAEGIERRPANDSKERPDRGFVEQPEERIAPPVKLPAPTVRRIAPVMLPDNHLRRRVVVRPAPSAPSALVRPFAERLLGSAPVTQVVATLEELEEIREMELDAAEREERFAEDEVFPAELQQPEDKPQTLVKLETRSQMAEGKPERRRYRFYAEETKADAIRRVVEQGEEQKAVARDLDITPSSLSKWIIQDREEKEVPRHREYIALELKLAAAARVKQVLASLPAGVSTRGVIAAVARETGVSTHGLSLWVKGKGLTKNGPPLPPSQNTTLLSRPEPPPAPSQVVSAPPPVSAPVTVVQESAPTDVATRQRRDESTQSLDSKLDALIDKQLDQLLERKLEAALKRRLGG